MDAGGAGDLGDTVNSQNGIQQEIPMLKSAPVLPPSEVEMEILGVTAKVITRSDQSEVVFAFDKKAEAIPRNEDEHGANGYGGVQQAEHPMCEDNLVRDKFFIIRVKIKQTLRI
eukprot:2871752-Pyramimonas_sp.AAC.1